MLCHYRWVLDLHPLPLHVCIWLQSIVLTLTNKHPTVFSVVMTNKSASVIKWDGNQSVRGVAHQVT